MIYYVRHDGTQTNKANAIRGGVASQALSVAGFNGETFSPGDEIIFERSGVYTSVIQVSGNGTAAAPIVVRGPGPAESQHAVVQVSGQNGISVTGNHLQVKNFSVTADSDKCFYVGSNSGIGGYTVKFVDCIAVANPGGDGFGTNSVASDATEWECVRCEARAITGVNNQGFTSHVDQLTLLTDCKTTIACETAMTMIGAETIVDGGEYYAFDTVFKFGQQCAGIINGAIGVADGASTARLVAVDSDGTHVTFNDCTLRHESASTTNNSLTNSDVSITFNGGSLTYSGGATSGFEWATSGAAGGVLRFTGGCVIKLKAMGARLARTNTAGGAIILDRVILDLSEVSGTGTIIALEVRNTSNGLKSSITNSLIIGPVPSNFVVMRMLDNTVSPVEIFNNTFANIAGTGSDVIASLLSTATAAISIRNNIFHNCVDAIQGTTGITKDYNVYSGTTPNESDTNGATSDPVFVDEARGNYRLAPTSPYRSNGNGLRGALDLAGRHRVNPPSRGAYQYRGGVRAASARRVAANR